MELKKKPRKLTGWNKNILMYSQIPKFYGYFKWEFINVIFK